ncbi:MAG TPA: ABC transporter substrate-binding protein, partial [Synergistales bacterium]|nr:ABC transporter substrate-binding protein [Synergistales bacterium]
SDSGGESALIGLDMLYSITQNGEVKPGYGGVNRGFYCNPEVDKLIDEAIATGDPAQRGEIMKKAWQLAADDVSYIPLYFEVDLYAHGKKITYTPRKDKYVFAWDVSFND